LSASIEEIAYSRRLTAYEFSNATVSLNEATMIDAVRDADGWITRVASARNEGIGVASSDFRLGDHFAPSAHLHEAVDHVTEVVVSLVVGRAGEWIDAEVKPLCTVVESVREVDCDAVANRYGESPGDGAVLEERLTVAKLR